jgi:hypothetical protein
LKGKSVPWRKHLFYLEDSTVELNSTVRSDTVQFQKPILTHLTAFYWQVNTLKMHYIISPKNITALTKQWFFSNDNNQSNKQKPKYTLAFRRPQQRSNSKLKETSTLHRKGKLVAQRIFILGFNALLQGIAKRDR